MRHKTFEDMDTYERWARRRARVGAVAWIGLGVLLVATSAPSGGYARTDAMVLVASVLVGLALAKVFEGALMPGVAAWGPTARRQRISWFIVMALCSFAIWLVLDRSGSALTVWPVLWAELIGSHVLALVRAKQYGRWQRERYEADLREIAEL